MSCDIMINNFPILVKNINSKNILFVYFKSIITFDNLTPTWCVLYYSKNKTRDEIKQNLNKSNMNKIY